MNREETPVLTDCFNRQPQSFTSGHEERVNRRAGTVVGRQRISLNASKELAAIFCMKCPVFFYFFLFWIPAAGFGQAQLVPFRRGAQWGYADQNRRLVLPLRYDDAGPFVAGRAWVRQGTRYGYIDTTGAAVTPVQFSQAGNFAAGRAWVTRNGEAFAIDSAGQRLPEPAPAPPDTDYLAQGDVVRQNGKVGFRFAVGQAVVPAAYDEIRENYRGLLFVRQGGRWGVVNNQGQLVQPVQFDSVQVGGTGPPRPIVVQAGRYGYLDAQGRTLVAPRYRRAGPFVGNAARVLTADGQPGYLDAAGTEFFE